MERTCKERLDEKAPGSMDLIMKGVAQMTDSGVHLVFDPTLVRVKKNAKFQVGTLEKNGYTKIRKIFARDDA